jgi:hypothetical protein
MSLMIRDLVMMLEYCLSVLKRKTMVVDDDEKEEERKIGKCFSVERWPFRGWYSRRRKYWNGWNECPELGIPLDQANILINLTFGNSET